MAIRPVRLPIGSVFAHLFLALVLMIVADSAWVPTVVAQSGDVSPAADAVSTIPARATDNPVQSTSEFRPLSVTSQIYGFISYRDGSQTKPAANAKVYLSDVGRVAFVETTTNANGYYEFPPLELFPEVWVTVGVENAQHWVGRPGTSDPYRFPR
ncbi:MAG: hypothetical protein CVU38_20155, partial [Chloroflexi bacterium HGW-Chloroflexi-1]